MFAIGDETGGDDADVRGDVEDATIGARDEEFGLDEFLDGDYDAGFGFDGDGCAGVFCCFCCVLDLRVVADGMIDDVRWIRLWCCV